MKRWAMGIMLGMALLCGQAWCHPVGHPEFRFECKLGAKSVRITSEGNELVYTYGARLQFELVIRGSAQRKNLFARHEMGMRSDAQKIRFVNGDYSYLLSSLFVAGAGGDDWVKFYVLRGDKVVRAQVCRGAASFEDFDQLDRLPRDDAIRVPE
jgi:hypothetical protein